jgi:hypothetical protein
VIARLAAKHHHRHHALFLFAVHCITAALILAAADVAKRDS